MHPSMILMNGLWAAVFAAAMGILLTAPARYIFPTLLCGFTGRVVRDLSMSVGMSQHSSTVVAAAVLVVVSAAIVRRQRISAVVLICAVLPLGAAVAMFNIMLDLMKVSSLEGEALSAAAIDLIANTGKAFAGTLAIVLGLGAGLAIIHLFQREQAEGV